MIDDVEKVQQRLDALDKDFATASAVMPDVTPRAALLFRAAKLMDIAEAILDGLREELLTDLDVQVSR